MKIGILECGRPPEVLGAKLGQYPSMFTRLLDGHGFRFQSWHVEDMEFPDNVHDADGWLITGSRHGVYEAHAFIAPLEQFIRDAFDVRVPVVGICFGHQAMAQALGGTVAKYQGGWAVGAQNYSFDTGPLRLNAWHQDQVVSPPDSAQTIGANAFCAHAALLYPGHGFSVQAHPEYSDAVIQGLIEHRGRGLVPDALLDRAETELGGAQGDVIATRIAAFFKEHAQVQA